MHSKKTNWRNTPIFEIIVVIIDVFGSLVALI